MIDPNNPLEFSQWAEYSNNSGASGDGKDIEAGQSNTADPNHMTWVNTACPNNATWFVENMDTSDPRQGAVGVFGRSHGTKGSIGVAGESETGCGVYGIATDGPTIGVAGRSMGGVAVEDVPLEEVLNDAIGVLGHSVRGPGVRGHGGPLRTLTQETPLPPVEASPGGVFSSGQLQDTEIPEAQASEQMSLDSLPQLRLVPSMRVFLPERGQIGDFFLAFLRDPLGAQLWICTDIRGTTPEWQKVQLEPGSTRPGGSPVT